VPLSDTCGPAMDSGHREHRGSGGVPDQPHRSRPVQHSRGQARRHARSERCCKPGAGAWICSAPCRPAMQWIVPGEQRTPDRGVLLDTGSGWRRRPSPWARPCSPRARSDMHPPGRTRAGLRRSVGARRGFEVGRCSRGRGHARWGRSHACPPFQPCRSGHGYALHRRHPRRSPGDGCNPCALAHRPCALAPRSSRCPCSRRLYRQREPRALSHESKFAPINPLRVGVV
jgi:hypothetical protein